MRQTAVEFEANGEMVEGVLAAPASGRRPFASALLCHAHPVFGGHMDSPAILAMAIALAECGIASLRFNFRAGQGDLGALTHTARQDIEAAWSMLLGWRDGRPRRAAVVGYSFGAATLARSAAALSGARAYCLISPSLSSLREGSIGTLDRPRLFLAGENDKIARAGEIEQEVKVMHGPTAFARIPGAGHDLAGVEELVAGLLAEFLTQHLL